MLDLSTRRRRTVSAVFVETAPGVRGGGTREPESAALDQFQGFVVRDADAQALF